MLSIAEVDRVLAQPRTATALGLRDRAILEVLYSTGIRRAELVALDQSDVDADRRLLVIREGKGRKDRVVPIGERALYWTQRYLADRGTRGTRFADAGADALFVRARGARIRAPKLTERLRAYLVRAGVAKPGSVHIFRHTMATHMHDNGADVRDLQLLLGHAELSTTEIYTHVSLRRLQQVHARTHPSASRGRDLMANRSYATSAIERITPARPLGPAPIVDHLKRDLAAVIARDIRETCRTQDAAARLLGVDQPRISRLLKSDVRGLSVSRLFALLRAFGRSIEVRVGARTAGGEGATPGDVTVRCADADVSEPGQVTGEVATP